MLTDPADEGIKFFFMLGHSFGLPSSAYNYNWRASLLTVSSKLSLMVPVLVYYVGEFGFD